MSDWHLDQLRAALAQRGWKILAVHDGDDHSISGSWGIQRSTRLPPLWLDFSGLDDLKCLPMSESFACQVRGHEPWLYFRRPGDKWRTELTKFLNDLGALTFWFGLRLPARRIDDQRTMSDMLAAKRAILFLHVEWSMPSAMAWSSFQKWSGERPIGHGRDAGDSLPLFVALNPDVHPHPVLPWLAAQGLEHLAYRGYGEVLWLENGRVVSNLYYTSEGILPELGRRTDELWGMNEPAE